MEKKTLGERCKEYRAKHRLTQEELAKKCGVHVNTIIYTETEKHSARMLTQAAIEKVIGVE